jgi:hypothetical protein
VDAKKIVSKQANVHVILTANIVINQVSFILNTFGIIDFVSYHLAQGGCGKEGCKCENCTCTPGECKCGDSS